MGKIFDALEKANKQPPIKNVVVHSAKKVEKKLAGDQVVVPLIKNRSSSSRDDLLDGKLITHLAPQSFEASFFKVLKTNLLFPSKGKTPRSILVTSAIPGDGKSFVAANVSISIAQGIEEHVLLIDCDMRIPTVHRLFGLTQSPGLSDFLRADDDLGSYLLKTPIEKLSILPSGKVASNPTELIAAAKMRALLDQVKTRYDDRYIVIDSPPPSIAPETVTIAQQVDGVILVVRSGKTPRNAVTDVIEKIGKEKIMGVVLNDCKKSVNKLYGYGKNYYNR